ncbi:hypothetical protein B0H13DRAFT_2154910 [Mycena leptocephala]|nr:hypothetical protein B0H13DRAFT_2154910 [Mycena leptocephala]
MEKRCGMGCSKVCPHFFSVSFQFFRSSGEGERRIWRKELPLIALSFPFWGLLLSALFRPSFLYFHSLALLMPFVQRKQCRRSSASALPTPVSRKTRWSAAEPSSAVSRRARVRTTSGPRALGASIRARPCTITPLRFRHLVCSLLQPGTRWAVDRRPNREIRERKGG